MSNVFEFHWCPDQNEFQVTVFKKGGPYLFRPQSPEVKTLEAEKAFMQEQHETTVAEMQEQHETTVAEMQAEIDQLQADKTGTIKVVFV